MDGLHALFSRRGDRGGGGSLPGGHINSSTCDLPRPLVAISTEPIAGDLDFYHVNVIVSGVLALFSTLVTLVLIWRHTTTMSRPREQLHIIRICLLLPIFAMTLWLGIYIPQTYVYMSCVMAICEPVTLTCYFLFVCETLAEPSSSSSRSTTFLAPLITRARISDASSLTDKTLFNTFRKNWIGLAQNIPVACILAIITIITEVVGVYCLTARDAHHAHLYVLAIRTISTVFALVAVLHNILPIKTELKKHRAITKLWAFKALIFMQVVQDFIFSIIDARAPRSLIESKTISRVDFITGIPSLIVEIEILVFALFLHYAYDVSLYRLSEDERQAGERYASYGWRLIYKVFDIRDVVAMLAFAFYLRKEVETYEMAELDKRSGQGSDAQLDGSNTDVAAPKNAVNEPLMMVAPFSEMR